MSWRAFATRTTARLVLRPSVRKSFATRGGHLVNFFMYAAQEVREILASMGYRSLDEIIGRNDLLSQVDKAPAKTSSLRLVLPHHIFWRVCDAPSTALRNRRTTTASSSTIRFLRMRKSRSASKPRVRTPRRLKLSTLIDVRLPAWRVKSPRSMVTTLRWFSHLRHRGVPVVNLSVASLWVV